MGPDTVEWTRLDFGLGRRRWAAAAFDSARGVLVLFGGNDRLGAHRDDTFEWDGTAWHAKVTAHHPSARAYSAMAFDSIRNRVVLFGGLRWSEGHAADTWEYDGDDWVQRFPATSPPVRAAHSMAFDSSRGRTVLYGGWAPGHNAGYSDTWEWDGTDWSSITSPANPGNRYEAAMTYDSTHGYTLLHGGIGGGSTTWTWNGSQWINRNANPSPTGQGHVLVNDAARQKLVMYRWGQTWEWNGTGWSQIMTSTTPPLEGHAAGGYDTVRHRTVLFGGIGPLGRSGDTWTYDGLDWTLAAPSSTPIARSNARAIFDPTTNRLVLFGGLASHNAANVDTLNDTWELDGNSWLPRAPVTSPSKRAGHVFVFDSARGGGVLFGGHSSQYGFSDLLGDTWTWSAGNWHLRSPEHAPSPRKNAAAAFDPSRGYVVLFGGQSDVGHERDTWLWMGADWSKVTPLHAPLNANGASMTYDAVRQRVVLYQSPQSWEWDGNDWQVAPAAPISPARFNSAMTFDTQRGRSILFGGGINTGYTAETWESDGSRWFKRLPASTPIGLMNATLAYDPVRQRAVLFGGYNDGASGLTYVYRVTPGDPGATCFSSAECSSGFCVDGVCCSTACGGNDPSDCQACSVQAGAQIDGTCAPVAPRVCRPVAGPCDVAESCTGVDALCPVDGFQPNTTVCSPKSSACVAAALCTGVSAACPAPSFEPAGTECRAPAGECRQHAVCDGLTADCGPNPPTPHGTPCDGGECVDGSCVVDAGVDPGTPADSGTPWDSGMPWDSGTPSDSGTPADAGVPVDASPGVPSDPQADAAPEAIVDSGASDLVDAGTGAVPLDVSPGEGDRGCGCRLVATRPPSPWALSVLLAAGLAIVRRRSRGIGSGPETHGADRGRRDSFAA